MIDHRNPWSSSFHVFHWFHVYKDQSRFVLSKKNKTLKVVFVVSFARSGCSVECLGERHVFFLRNSFETKKRNKSNQTSWKQLKKWNCDFWCKVCWIRAFCLRSLQIEWSWDHRAKEETRREKTKFSKNVPFRLVENVAESLTILSDVTDETKCLIIKSCIIVSILQWLFCILAFCHCFALVILEFPVCLPR